MKDAMALRDEMFAEFISAIRSAYDVNDLLSIFWTHAAQLVQFEVAAMTSKQLDAFSLSVDLIDIDRQSFDAEGFLSNQLDQLKELVPKMKSAGLAKTSDALRLFLIVILEVSEEPAPNCWCQDSVQELVCPDCRHVGRYRLWNVVNTTLRPDLRFLATEGKLDSGASCIVCGRLLTQTHFLYCDPGREEFLVVWPPGAGAVPDELIDAYRSCVRAMPLEMRGGKEQLLIVRDRKSVV